MNKREIDWDGPNDDPRPVVEGEGFYRVDTTEMDDCPPFVTPLRNDTVDPEYDEEYWKLVVVPEMIATMTKQKQIYGKY